MISIFVTFLELLAVYFDWLSFPIILGCIWLIKKRKYRKISIIVLVVSLLFIWAHYIEPHILLVKEETIHGMGFNADIVLIADPHLGYYKDQNYLKRVVEKINKVPADYVVIAGDFLYKTDEKYYKTLFAPLKNINKPVYAVRGNHDYGYIRRTLPDVLESYNVNMIENKLVDLGDYQLAGIGDRNEGYERVEFLDKAVDKPILVVTHNPDTSDKLSAYNVPLMLAGHTHCGQIRIPILYKFVIKSEYGFDCGYSLNNSVPVFITPGVGENNLPLRLFNPPTINVLHLRY